MPAQRKQFAEYTNTKRKRPWQDIARELSHEQDSAKVSQLANDLSRALIDVEKNVPSRPRGVARFRRELMY
jgi:hypothetical protein